MSRRLPFRTAIAGLTALTIVTPSIYPAGLSPIAIAQVREDHSEENQLSFNQPPATVAYNTAANFTVNVPNADGGSVQFFLDNVAVGTPVTVTGGQAIGTITPKSFLEHTVTARFVDKNGFNPREDVTVNFNTPVNIPPERKSGNSPEYDSYTSTVNGKTGTVDNPVSDPTWDRNNRPWRHERAVVFKDLRIWFEPCSWGGFRLGQINHTK